MQLKSNNNACKTPNLAVCKLLTLTKWKCKWDTQVNRIQRSEQVNHQEHLEDHQDIWMHAIDTKLMMRL